MIDVYVTENHPFYQVWVDGEIYDTFTADNAVRWLYRYPLTWSQMADVASYYREALDVAE